MIDEKIYNASEYCLSINIDNINKILEQLYL